MFSPIDWLEDKLGEEDLKESRYNITKTLEFGRVVQWPLARLRRSYHKEKILAAFPTHGAGAVGVGIGGFTCLGWYQ